MKKSLFALALVPLAFAFAACDSDDDHNIPDVSVDATVEGGTFNEHGVIVVDEGTDLTVTAVTIKNNTGKDAAIGAVNYFLDGYPVGTALTAPYGITLPTGQLGIGRHVMVATFPVYVVDYPVCSGYARYDIDVVAPTESTPPADPLSLKGHLRLNE